MNFEYVQMSSEEEAERYFSETGHWVVANIRQLVGWPEKKVVVYFRNVPILFIPEEDDRYPAVAIRCKNGVSRDKAREMINHFLSSLVWSEGKVVKVELWGGGSRPNAYGKSRDCKMLSKPFRIMYLPDTSDIKARLALAFYREALSLDHSAYSFLSFYKIINIKFKNGPKQKKWIGNNLKKVDYYDGKERIGSLRKDIGPDDKIADYLYHSCRCAIAHADIKQKIVNPEDYEDMLRLRLDLPLVRGLSEILIEDEFGILKRRTLYKTHPYELFGFKSILGEDVSERIVKGQILVKDISFPEKISLRLWGEFLYKIFEEMRVVNLSIEKGELVVQAISSNNMAAVVFGLNFRKERITFDPQASIRMVKDDGSISLAESNLEINRFLRRYWMNGVLEIWDTKDCKCLGFSDAFIRVNIDMSRTVQSFDQQIKTYEEEVEKRKLAEKSKA